MFALDPFGLTSASDKASTDTLNRIASLWYSNSAQKDITIVLIDDSYLKDLASHWPLSYTQQSILFRQILVYSPSALFVDLIYHHDRSTDTDSLARLNSVFQRFSQTKSIPTYLPKASTETDYLAAGQLDHTYPVRIAWDGFGYHYPLEVDGTPSAAKALYLHYCKSHACADRLSESSAPIALQWGSRIAAIQSDISSTAHCEPTPTLAEGAGKILLSELFWKFVPRWRQNCPYHTTAKASQLAANDAQAKALFNKIITDRIVLVGALIQGARDEITSPVHGQLPGVYLHAMALDNLITYGSNYVRPAPAIIKNLDIVDLLDAIFLLLVVIWQDRLPEKEQPEIIKRHRLWGAMIIFLILLATFITTFIFHFEPVNWLGLLILVISVALYQLHWRALCMYFKTEKGEKV